MYSILNINDKLEQRADHSSSVKIRKDANTMIKSNLSSVYGSKWSLILGLKDMIGAFIVR